MDEIDSSWTAKQKKMHPEKGLLCQFVFQTEILLIRLYFKSKYQIVLLLNFQVFEKEHWGGKNRERRK